MEFMLQYDCKIVYIKEENCAADALSQTSFKAEKAAGVPYPSDNVGPMALIWGTYDSSFVYAKVTAEPEMFPQDVPVAPTLTILADMELLDVICSGYPEDPWCC